MTIISKAALGAGLALALAAQPAFAAKKDKEAPAAAPAVAAAAVLPGVGIASIDAIRVNSNAFKNAEVERPKYYKAIIDQAEARARAIQAELKAMADKFQAARKLPNANQAALQEQARAIQARQQAGQQEVDRMLMPVELSRAYVDEQIADQLDKAIDQAKAKKRITLLISPDVVIRADPEYNMNQPILDELNALLPNAQFVPPPGWEPRQVREARAQQAAQQAAQQGTAPAAPAPRPATPAGPQPEGR